MRVVTLAVVALASMLGGCGRAPVSAEEQARFFAEGEARAAAMRAQNEAARAAAEAAMTPAQRAQRDLGIVKALREYELLQRALSGSPDYAVAVTRAATANVDGAAAIPLAPGERRPPVNQRAREAAIRAEEARLSDAVEVRRRQQLAQDAQQRQGQQDQMAAAQCIALGQQIEASMFSQRSLLNLEGAIAGAQARDQCWAAYQARR